jgi:hypothetical protein
MDNRSRLQLWGQSADAHPTQSNVSKKIFGTFRLPRFPIVFYQLKYPFPLPNRDTQADGIEADFTQTSNAVLVAFLEDI